MDQNKSVSNRIPCASRFFSWTSQHQLELDGTGSWVSHFYFLTDRNIKSVASVIFLRSSQTLTVGKFTSVASVTFSGSNSVKRNEKGDLQKYLENYISGSVPTIQSAKKRNRLVTEVLATGNSEASSTTKLISRISTRNHTMKGSARITTLHQPTSQQQQQSATTTSISTAKINVTSAQHHNNNNQQQPLNNPYPQKLYWLNY